MALIKKRLRRGARWAKVKSSRVLIMYFADLGLPHPEQCFEKAKLVSEIREIIKAKKLTQAKAAKLLRDRISQGFQT